MIPLTSVHRRNAEALMNYYYEPEVAAKLAAWNNYICPVQGAQQAMEKIDSSLVDNTLIFPDEALLAGAFDFMPLTEAQNTTYGKGWSDVIGG